MTGNKSGKITMTGQNCFKGLKEVGFYFNNNYDNRPKIQRKTGFPFL